MFINITDSKEAANKGSSSGLVHYLEKENRLDHKHSPEYWFNGQQIRIGPYEVKSKIDSNIAKLGKDDAKFFLINISPSQKEIAFFKGTIRRGWRKRANERVCRPRNGCICSKLQPRWY